MQDHTHIVHQVDKGFIPYHPLIANFIGLFGFTQYINKLLYLLFIYLVSSTRLVFQADMAHFFRPPLGGSGYVHSEAVTPAREDDHHRQPVEGGETSTCEWTFITHPVSSSFTLTLVILVVASSPKASLVRCRPL